MADQNLEIIARLQDLMTGPLKAIEVQVDKLAREIEATNARTRTLEESQQAVSGALKETTAALVGEAQAQRKAREETERFSKATKQASVDQRELAGAAGDVARNLGLNVGPLQAIATAAGPLAATVAAVVGLSEALGAVVEKSKQIDQALKPALGRVGAGALQGFREDLLRLSSETNVAAEEIAAGLSSIFQNTTARSREAVNDLLKQATLLSKVGFGPVASAVQALDGVLGAFQLRIQEASKVTAILATSADRAGVPIDQFANALQAAGPLARQFGLSLSDVSALIVSIKNQGVGLNDATRAIGGLLQIFSEQGNATRKALEGIGVNFQTASRDGEGFAQILADIADKTRNQPELLAQLFPGGARTLQGVFAAVQGSAADFRKEIERTSQAAQDFATQNQRAAENTAGYWKKTFNEISNSAVSVFNEASNAWALVFAGLTGDISKARGEYAALLQSVSQSGIEVEFFKARGVSQQAATFVREVEAAIAAEDPEAVVRVVADLSSFAQSVDSAVGSVVQGITAQVGRLGLGEDVKVGLAGSPLAKLLQLNEADIKLLEGQLGTIFENFRDSASRAGQKIDTAALSSALSSAIERALPAINKLPESVGAAVAKANERLAQLGGVFDGQVGQLKVQGDRIALVFEDIAAASERSANRQAAAQQVVIPALALYAVELGKAAAAAQNAQAILESTLPAKDREALALDRQIANVEALIATYAAEGLAIENLTRALDNLTQKREELSGGQRGTAERAIFSEISQQLAAEALRSERAAVLKIQADAEAQLKLDARAFQEAQDQLLADAQRLADERSAARQNLLRLAYTPAITIAQEDIQRLVTGALGPLSEQLRVLEQAFSSGEISVAEYNRQLAVLRDSALAIRQDFESQITFAEAFSSSIDDLRAELSDVQKQAQSFAQDLTSGLSNAFEGLFNNIAEGKASLRDFGQTIVQVIQQAIARLFALKAASAFLNIFSGGAASGGGGGIGPGVDGAPLGLAMGGVVPGRMKAAQVMGNEEASRWRQVGSALKAGSPVRSYAMGGVATRPQVAVFGEGGGAEAFVPLPGPNRGIPVEFKRGQRPAQEAGTTVQQSVNLTLNVGSLDPRTAADVVLAQMPQIQAAITQAISAGRDRALLGAVRGAVR
jgi:TP901 family phage tail tape measure protein